MPQKTCAFCGEDIQHRCHNNDDCGKQCTCRCQWGECYACHNQGWGYLKSHTVQWGNAWWQQHSSEPHPSDTFICNRCLDDDEVAWCTACDRLDYAVWHPATDAVLCLQCFEERVEPELYSCSCEDGTIFDLTLLGGHYYHIRIRTKKTCGHFACFRLEDDYGALLGYLHTSHFPTHMWEDLYPEFEVTADHAPQVVQRLLYQMLDIY